MSIKFWAKGNQKGRDGNDGGDKMEKHGRQAGKKNTCGICGRKSPSVEDLMNHMQVFHGKDQKYDCRRCNMLFSSMEDMRTHLQKTHRYTGSKNQPAT